MSADDPDPWASWSVELERPGRRRFHRVAAALWVALMVANLILFLYLRGSL